MTKLGRAAARVAAAAAGVSFAVAAAEVALRLSWCGASAAYEYQSKPFLTANPYWGTWHIPNDEVEHRKSCFTAHYTTNELGMKGGPLRPGAKRIALLGDSFIEGFGNDNDETAAHSLERLLGPRYQVLNFGVSGNFSTIDELVIYDDFAKFFDPDVVLLFFLNYNDLEDLLDPGKQTLIDRDLNLVYPRVRELREVTAHLEQQSPPNSPTPRAGSCLIQFLATAHKIFVQRIQMVMHLHWDFRHELARPYLPAEDAEIRHAWAIVEASLARLRDITRDQGATLVVVDIGDPYQLDPSWIGLASIREGTALSPTHPNERLGAICSKLGIRFYDMYPETQAYIARHGLRYPFLSFACDRHYDREGQQLIAKLVFGYLDREKLVDHPPGGSQ
jgi:GDSL-like Lipase/Acylhydrolase family